MKHLILAASAAALLAGTVSAQAADIVTYQEQPIAAEAPAFTWTGFYFGGTAGGSWAQAKSRLRHDGATLHNSKVKPSGFIGGVFGGYNFQVASFNNVALLKDLTFGIETDFLWDDVSNSQSRDLVRGFAGARYPYGKMRVKQNWNGATRLRVGYALGSEGRFMPYVAAGGSYADVSARYDVYETRGGSRVYRKSKGDTRGGWNVGAGVDYAPPILNDHLILRAEYRYTDFGKKTYNLQGLSDTKYRVKYNQNDFRVGVAYKF